MMLCLEIVKKYYFLMSLIAVWLLTYQFGILCELDFDWNVGEEDDAGGLMQMETVLGKTAKLPCDVESPFRGDHRVYMVLWFKENSGKPLYSFDVRGRSFNKALHWSDVNVFGPRSSFVTVAQPAHLQLQNVQLRDEGVYRCRVDYRNAPTRNFQINLTVIVPPHQLIIYDNSGREIISVAGPLTEGSNLHLTCEVRGGKPVPKISWYMDDVLLESSHDSSSLLDNRIIVRKIEILKIGRFHLNRTFCCQASNTELIKPQTKSFTLLIYLYPISTKITLRPLFLQAGEEYTFRCEVIGSIPDPQITWWKGDKLLLDKAAIVTKNGSRVISEFLFTFNPDDDGELLVCRAENIALANSVLEDSVSLNVLYPPIISMHLGSSLDPDNIKEGVDVYFECRVRCNPPQHKINWYHNNQLVIQNVSSGVIVSSQSLVLQKVTYQNGGIYSCQANNEIGESASKSVNLELKYAPKCIREDVTVITGLLEETIYVSCEVTANPEELDFIWQFNNTSGGTFPLSPKLHRTVNRTISRLAYKPTSEFDYGLLICRAQNSVGKQSIPCMFHILPAIKPSGLKNCTAEIIVNEVKNWLKISCLPCYEDESRTTYHLDIVLAHSLLLNLTNLVPTFFVDPSRLDAEQLLALDMYLYSTNSKGKSEVIALAGNVFRNADKRTEVPKRSEENSKPLSKLTFIILCLIAAVFAMIIFSLLFVNL